MFMQLTEGTVWHQRTSLIVANFSPFKIKLSLATSSLQELRWESDQGPIIRLVESKAKQTPLDQKGDAVKQRYVEQCLHLI